MSTSNTLTPHDLAMFKAIGVTTHDLDGAGVRRVTHQEARELCGITYKSDHLEGIAFPYLEPESEDRRLTYRVKRDNPEVGTDGNPIAKYVSPPDRRHLYFGFDAYASLSDITQPVIIVEAEKSVLAIIAATIRANRSRVLPIGTGGCWGWRGVVGKTTSPNGTRVDEKGVLSDFDRITWTARDTIIAFDSNVTTNEKVQIARRALAAELEKRGACVRLLDLPVEDGINGPDDYIGKHGAAAFFALVDAAKRPSQRRNRRRRSRRNRSKVETSPSKTSSPGPMS